MGIFINQFLSLKGQKKKFKLTSKTSKPYYTTFWTSNKLFIIWLGIVECKSISVHTSIDLVFMELSSWKSEELQITIPTCTNNPALVEALCPVNNLEAFSVHVHTWIAWSGFWAHKQWFSSLPVQKCSRVSLCMNIFLCDFWANVQMLQENRHHSLQLEKPKHLLAPRLLLFQIGC